MISLALRSGIPVARVIRQLRGIGGSSQVFSGGARVFSIPDAIAQVLLRRFPEAGDSSDSDTILESEICPECSQAMSFDAGCYLCRFCGYSSC